MNHDLTAGKSDGPVRNSRTSAYFYVRAMRTRHPADRVSCPVPSSVFWRGDVLHGIRKRNPLFIRGRTPIIRSSRNLLIPHPSKTRFHSVPS